MKPDNIKNLGAAMFAIGCIGLIVTLCVGCKTNRQVIEKSTVFGFQAKSPGPSGSQICIQFGLVRNFSVSNPTSTNEVYVAGFSSHVDADMTALHQNGKESMSSFPQQVESGTSETNSTTSVKTTR